MTDLATMDAYGALIKPATLKIERMLPGPVERIWAYLTDSDLRAKWLASGVMTLTRGAGFELVWRNDELTDVVGERPEGFAEEMRMESTIVEADPPHRLTFTWGERGEVTFELEPMGKEVLLTVIHRRISDRRNMLMVGAGWHMHLDILVAVASGRKPSENFWAGWMRLRDDYDRRLPD